MGNPILAALRVACKKQGLTYKASPEMREAADAILRLDELSHDGRCGVWKQQQRPQIVPACGDEHLISSRSDVVNNCWHQFENSYDGKWNDHVIGEIQVCIL